MARRDDEETGRRALAFGCLAAVLMLALVAGAAWVIFAWDVNRR